MSIRDSVLRGLNRFELDIDGDTSILCALQDSGNPAITDASSYLASCCHNGSEETWAGEDFFMGTVELNLLEVLREKDVSLGEFAALAGIGEESTNKTIEVLASAVRLSTLVAICESWAES